MRLSEALTVVSIVSFGVGCMPPPNPLYLADGETAKVQLLGSQASAGWCKSLGTISATATTLSEARYELLHKAAALHGTAMTETEVPTGVMSALFSPTTVDLRGQVYDCSLRMENQASENEYAQFRAPGSASISGQAFLTTRGGDVKVAAGRPVTLDPATAYALEWYSKIGTDAARFEESPPSEFFQRSRRSTTSDAQGRFRFDGLAPGLYIVRTIVQWEAGVPLTVQGGVVSDTARVRDGERREVIVSRTRLP